MASAIAEGTKLSKRHFCSLYISSRKTIFTKTYSFRVTRLTIKGAQDNTRMSSTITIHPM